MKIDLHPGAPFTFFLLLIFSINLYSAWEWPYQARLFPWAIGIPAVLLCLMQLWRELLQDKEAQTPESSKMFLDLAVDRGVPPSIVVRRAANIFAWICGFFFTIWLLGFIIAVPLFVLCYLRGQARETWGTSILATGAVFLCVLALFHYILRMSWPAGVIAAPQDWILGLLG